MSNALSLAKLAGPIVRVGRKGIRFLSKNSNLILTIISATGVAATVWVTITGTIKAVKLCEEKKVVGRRQVIETVWKCYIPTVGIALLTTTAILCNGKINARRLAVLTSAYSGSIETIKKIEEKMSEQIGPKKTQKAIDDAETEIAKENSPRSKEDIIATGKGSQLFYLRSTGQWFYSDHNGIELAELKINNEIEKLKKDGWGDDVLPVSFVQEALGISVTEMGDYMGWDISSTFPGNVGLGLIISSDWMDLPWGKEVVGVIRFSHWPDNL